MKSIFSVDVEDWFHILELDSTPDLNEWDRLESRVEMNFIKMLDLFDVAGIKVTCFFLGWIAQKFPNLVREAQSRNHEVASHGYAHQLINTLNEKMFFEDIQKTKKILEDITGAPVLGYRAPGFSITPETSWASPLLVKAGYKYDSSLFPAKRGHGYFLDVNKSPFKFENIDLYEFPITITSLFSHNICFFGGGYLRLFPYFLIKRMAKKVAREKRPVIYYVHPRELDVDQPRLPMNSFRSFKSYINLQTTCGKIKKTINSNQFVTFKDFISQYDNIIPRSASIISTNL